jgi:hypothetical protein
VKRIGVEEGVLAKLTREVLPMVPGFFNKERRANLQGKRG